MGYETDNAVLNSGPIFLYSCLIILVMIFIKLVSIPMKKWKKTRLLYDKISKTIFFNAVLRFFIEGYLEIAVSAFVNVKERRDSLSGEAIAYYFSCNIE